MLEFLSSENGIREPFGFGFFGEKRKILLTKNAHNCHILPINIIFTV